MRRLVIAAAAAAAAASVAAGAFAATIIGTAQADVLRGTPRADTIRGQSGNDRILGLAGADRIYPGPGRDVVSCGPGSDVVFADAADRIAADCEVIRRVGASPPPAAPPPPPPPAVGTRSNPIPVGTDIDLGDGWRMRVDSTIPDATAQVLARNQFNDPPEPGRQFFIVRVSATYTGPASRRFDAGYRLRAVGAAGVSYSTFEDSCGVIPDEISAAEVFTGGTVTGNECWQVRSSDVSSLVLYDDPLLGDDSKRLFFALG